MAKKKKNRKRKDRRKLVPLMMVAILAAHGVLFLLLAQCGGKAAGKPNEFSYIPVQKDREEVHQLGDLQMPPERMFYQLASAPQVEGEEELEPLTESQWDGYEALVALTADTDSPMEGYRLALDFENELGKVAPSPKRPGVDFLTVSIDGVPMQPVTPVPEPGLMALFGWAPLGLLLRRSR